MTVRCLGAALAGFLLMAAAPSEEDPFASLTPIEDEVLSEQRGGFEWQGLQINFRAELSTYLNGSLALKTELAWNGDGSSITQYVNPELEPAQAATLNGTTLPGDIAMLIGGQNVFLANSGQTALAHAITDDGIQNFLLNTHDSVSALQNIDATVDLTGYERFQQEVLSSALSTGLDASWSSMLAGVLR